MAALTPSGAAGAGALFPLAPLSPSQTDPSSPGVIVNARSELHRALDFGSDVDCAAWARRWGEAILKIDHAADDEIECLRRRLDEAEAELLEPVDTGGLDDAHNELSERLETIRRALADAPGLLTLKDRISPEIDMAIDALKDAQKEAARL